MRDGRRKRLGLQEGTEGTVGDTYLDRILTDAEAAGNPYTIAADTDVNFDTRDFRNIADTYNYYYGGGFDTAQDDATPPSSGDGGSSDGGTGGGTTPTQPDSIGGFAPGGNTGSGYFDLIDNSGKDFGPYSSSMPSMLDQTGRMGATTPPSTFGTPVDVEQGFTQDYSVTGALGVDPLEKDDVLSGAVTQEDVDNPKGLLTKLGISPDFDIKKALIETGVNLIAGVPITLIAKALEAVLPEMDPRQKALREFYKIDDIGRVAEGELMAGYNPVSGGGLYTLTGGRAGEEPTYGLQDAYDDRINTIENTLANKYNMTAAEIADVKAGNYTGDVDTELFDRLNQLEEAKEKEKGRLDLFSGDVDERDQMLEDISLQNKIAAGIQTADDDSGSEMLDTTPKESTLVDQVDTPKQVESTTMSDISLADMPMQEFEDLINNVDDFGKSIDLIESRTKGQEYLDDLDEIGKGDAYIDYTEQEKADIAAGKKEPQLGELVDFAIAYAQATDPTTDTTIGPSDQDIIDRGGGDDISTGGLDPNRGQQVDRGTSGAGDNQPVSTTTGPPSTGFQPQSTYDAELEDDRDVGGGGNEGNNSNRKIVCTMMNNSYGFGSFRNKIWLKNSKDMAPEYQKGYHKIFLPLVKIAKTNKIVKKTLEHIAVHRTIDIRQESRGKIHLLGRVYRKILEPICYIVGKYAK